VNQLIGCVRSRNGPWERPLVEAIALDNLDARSDTLLQKFRVSDKTTNATPGLLQCRKETPSDVASGSSQQDQRAPTGIKMRTAMSESTVNHLFRARNGKRRVLTLYAAKSEFSDIFFSNRWNPRNLRIRTVLAGVRQCYTGASVRCLHLALPAA
jgi:hypothetical protein